jgi:hypothetical protein
MATTNFSTLIIELQNFATNNAFINRFGFGPIDNVEETIPNDGTYPILWVIPQGVVLDDNSIVYNLRVLVFDIDERSDGLREQILTDCLLTMNDFVKYFRIGDAGDDYSLLNKPQAVPFEQQFVDYCVGWYADVQIGTDGMNGPCDFPQK